MSPAFLPIFCYVTAFVLLSAQIQSPIAKSEAPAGQTLFASNCASCHGLDGRGGEHAPNIVTGIQVQNLTEQDLLRVVKTGIPAAGMPGFSSSLTADQIASVVKYLRALQGSGKTADLPGDPERGRELFFGRNGCSECHMVNGKGGFLGVDLSAYGKTHRAAEIREAIVDPNKNLDPRYGMVVVTTRRGEKYTGIVRNEDNFSLQMQTPDGNFHLFEKTDLARIQHKELSLMPADYGSRLTKAELDDLVSYLAKTSESQATEARKDGDE